MNKIFLNNRIAIGDVVRITTKEAVGVIGKVVHVDIDNDGIEIEGFKKAELLDQIDNAIEFDIALFPISDIKYIFKLTLEEPKPIIEYHGTNDSQS